VELQALIDRFGLAKQVIVCPFRTNPYPLIANARLLVLSSDREGLPNVLIEALICHTPVVSTDCPSGPREILQQPLVPCGDAVALAKALVEALDSPAPLSHLDLTSYLPSEVASKYEVLCNNRK
jgi:glycosyltransferase involved in cell wall biosynthesis